MSDNHSNRLLYAMILGIVVGIFLGGLLPEVGKSVHFIGELFLKALMMLVVPLIMASMIVGISGLGDVRKLGKLGLRTFLFFMTTTGLAVCLGLVLVTIIQPGVGSHDQPPASIEKSDQSESPTANHQERPQTIGALLQEVLVKLVPKNLFVAMAETDVLALIVFSLVFGGVLTTMGERGQFVIRFFEVVNEAIMGIVHLLMFTAPIGIGCLVAGKLGEAGGFSGFGDDLAKLGAYVGTVLLALALHAGITLALFLRFVGKRSVWTYARNLGPALTTAFSTGSSAATLPLTMEGVTEENGVRSRIASFVLPLGTTINMNGTALYEAVAAVFIAQVYGIHLGMGELLIVCLTATLAAVGAAGIPEAGLVTMVIVLKAVGLPIEGLSLLLIIDWFLDRCRTAVNVWGDAVGAGVLDQLEGGTDKED